MRKRDKRIDDDATPHTPKKIDFDDAFFERREENAPKTKGVEITFFIFPLS